ncbi:retrotransposable element Tf2 [Tanacetum coccineum]
MKWLPKLMGFDYEIMYKKGAENVVVDALSRIHSQLKFLQMGVITLSSELYDRELKSRIEKLQSNSSSSKHDSWSNRQLLRKGKLVISNDEILKSDLMKYFHSGLDGGHSKMQGTIKRMHALLKEWVNWIHLAEYWYNTSYHTTIKTTPYQFVFGQPLPAHITYSKGDSLVEVVDRSLTAKESVIALMKFHIKRSQDRIKSLADKHRSERDFEDEAWVYLKLQPYSQATIRQGKQYKLSSKYFGPFLVEKKVGKVAYKLQLPSSSQTHPVFHVLQLKPYKGPLPLSSA